MTAVRRLRFCCLGSGSRGNATVVEKGDTCILIDCGLSLRETERRLHRLTGRSPRELTAILTTHEHGDHVRGIGQLGRNYGIPVWMTAGTAAALGECGIPRMRVFHPHECFAIDDIEVQPYPVPHDAREPCQFVLGDGVRRLGILTDTGSTTPHIEAVLAGCHALMLECNYDDELLARSSYPPVVRERIAGCRGHLSNTQAARLLQRIDCSLLQQLVAAHISEQNNSPDLVRAALSRALDCTEGWVGVATQDGGLGWREIL